MNIGLHSDSYVDAYKWKFLNPTKRYSDILWLTILCNKTLLMDYTPYKTKWVTNADSAAILWCKHEQICLMCEMTSFITPILQPPMLECFPLWNRCLIDLRRQHRDGKSQSYAWGEAIQQNSEGGDTTWFNIWVCSVSLMKSGM